jgi:hypothetical protein
MRTEYLKHAAHSPFFSVQNAVCFIMLPFFGSCIIHILHTGCANIKKKFRRQRVNQASLFHRTCVKVYLMCEYCNVYFCVQAC